MSRRCLLCQKTFKRPKNLERHLASIHGNDSLQTNQKLEKALHDNDQVPHNSDGEASERNDDAEADTQSSVSEEQTTPPAGELPSLEDTLIQYPNPSRMNELSQTSAEPSASSHINTNKTSADADEENKHFYKHHQRMFKHAGQAFSFGDKTGYSKATRLLVEKPFDPFPDAFTFTFARWFIEFQVTDAQFNSMASILYFTDKIKTRSELSKNKLKLLAHQLEPRLDRDAWREATVHFDDRPTKYYYRNPLELVTYMLSQPAYKDHLVYAPVKEYNADGERIYSELHTGDWWWRTQVCEEHVNPVDESKAN